MTFNMTLAMTAAALGASLADPYTYLVSPLEQGTKKGLNHKNKTTFTLTTFKVVRVKVVLFLPIFRTFFEMIIIAPFKKCQCWTRQSSLFLSGQDYHSDCLVIKLLSFDWSDHSETECSDASDHSETEWSDASNH